VDLHVTRPINRPAAEVFDFLANAANNPRWQKGMRSCVWTSSGGLRLGATYRQEARFLGRTLRNDFEVIAYEPGRSVTIRSTGGSFPITVRRSVEPTDPHSSEARAEISGEPGGFFRLAGPLLRRLAQRSVDADYDRLRGLLESPR
jgi:uncharacterized protein YndB with AHSA1/START domain